MSAGWVLVQTHDGVGTAVADALAQLPGVETAEHTAGAYDVVARVSDAGAEVRSAKRVMQAALGVPGVTLAVCCHDGGLARLDLTDGAAPGAEAAPHSGYDSGTDLSDVGVVAGGR